MAGYDSAQKRERQIERRTLVNKSRLSRMRSFLRKVEDAIGLGDQEKAREALRLAQPEMMRAASKGVLHSNTVSRKLSRLSARVKTMLSR